MDEQIDPAEQVDAPGSDPYPDDVPASVAGEPAESADAGEAVESAAPLASARPSLLPPPAPSGLPSVDSAVERLAALADLPVEDHVEVFDDVQRRLHDSLTELDDEQ